jgi:uncharacterized Zn finger protein
MRYDDDYSYGFAPYVSVRVRRAQAARELAKLQKKDRQTSPVVIDGRKIARTFWGVAWCDNLERYSDFANRLPRGRSYVRHGSVIDLRIEPGRVTALVIGSSMYDVKVTVQSLPKAHWSAIRRDCSGAIDSVIELLQGRLSQSVMTRLCQEKTGMFPSPKDISFRCSCPDWASMCKHVAAVLYGIGARLDHRPELLFTLRMVDQQGLIANAGSGLSKPPMGPGGAKVLVSDNLSEIFGIEMASAPPALATASRVASKRSSPARSEPSSAQTGVARPVVLEKDRLKRRDRSQGKRSGLTPAKRRALSERMRELWAARRASQKKQKKQKALGSS